MRRAAWLPGAGWALGAALLAPGGGCGRLPSPPGAQARVETVEPSGSGVPTALSEAAVTFTAPVKPEGLVAGRLALAPAAAEKEAVAAVESQEGATDLSSAVPAQVTLEDGGRRAVLLLRAPLHALVPYALVVSSKLEAADGRPVLDAQGRKRPTVATFQTGRAPGLAARPVIVEVRADAETPEAGGEYLIVENRGAGSLDAFGHQLQKTSPAGHVTSCTLGEGRLASGAWALVAGAAYDQRYQLPAGTPVWTCGSTALLGGLANDRFPSLRLVDPEGTELSTAGASGGPTCAIAGRLDPDGADQPGNWGCLEE
jgi:hypothetical protein